MICPKCKEDVPRNNFCGNCGAKLLEKCPECGKMEPIGRKVCESKLAEAKENMYSYIFKKGRVGIKELRYSYAQIFLFSWFSIFLAGIIDACFFFGNEKIFLVVFFLSALVITLVVLYLVNDLNKQEKNNKELLKKK